MTTDYYEREATRHVDGTPVFQTPADERAQARVAEHLARAWQCQVCSFGRLAPVDWYAVRDGRIVGVMEVKARTHPAGRYPTVFLNVRKWLALLLAGAGMGVPPIFVVQFTDCVMWVRVDALTPTVRVGGCRQIVKSRNDIEPVLEVPIASMHRIGEASDGSRIDGGEEITAARSAGGG